jgi:hypothetical protein
MTDFNLDAFLAAQQAEGVSQGEGDFTVSHEKARAKLTRYSLPREHSWVLKLVQAAVGWRCSKIVVSQTRTESTFWFQTEDLTCLPSNDQLVSSLLRSDFDSHDPLDRFGTALRILVERAHLSFQLQIERMQEDTRAVYAGVYFTEQGEAKRLRLRKDWGAGVTVMIHHISHTEPNRWLLNFLPVRSHSLPMLCELERYAYVSPVPIRVDGRWIDGPLRSSHLNWRYHRKPLRIDGLEVDGTPDLPIAEGFGDRSFTVRTSERRANRKPYQMKTAPAFLIVGLEVERVPYEILEPELRSFVHWVCDGVIVQTVKPLATQNVVLHVYANASGLRTDLTSFHLVETDEFQQRRRLVYEAVSQYLVSEIDSERDIFEDDDDEKSVEDMQLEYKALREKRRGMAAKVAFGSMAFAPFTGMIAPGTVLTGLAASAYVATRAVKVPEVNWEVKRITKRYLKELKALASRFLELAGQDRSES